MNKQLNFIFKFIFNYKSVIIFYMKNFIAFLIFSFFIQCFAADVSYFGVIKSQHYRQTDSSTVSQLPTNGFGFNAFVVANQNGVLTNASVSRSGSSQTHWLLPETDDRVWRYTEFFNSLSALDSAYPVGNILNPVNYTMKMYTVNDGIKTSNLRFFLALLPLSWPTTPQVLNFDEAQAIKPDEDFTLSWNDLGGSSLDIVQVLIVDSVSNIVFMSPAPLSEGALNGASRNITIPSNTLPENTTLEGHIIIAKPGSPDLSYTDATGIAALAKDTMFPVKTKSLRPVIKYMKKQSNLIMSWSEQGFKLQKSEDLINWTDVPGNPQNLYQTTIIQTQPKMFFRLIK
jgi:hypothetical protein